MNLTEETKKKVLEYQKCKDNLFHFCENYVKLAQSGIEVVPKLYTPQKKFLQSLIDDHYCVLLKTRQTGGSTASQMYCAWAMVFFKNIVVGIVSRKGSEATDFAKKVMNIIENLPDWLRPKFNKQTEQTFRLENGSELFAEAVISSNPGGIFRGKSITIAVIDEAAYTNYIDEAYTSFAPALFKAHKVAAEQNVPYALMIISTPNRAVGIGKWYFDTWAEARNKNSIFKGHTLYWKDIEDFANDPTWYETQCKILKNDQGRIKQELEMEFLGSTDSWLPLDVIDTLHKCHIEPLSVVNFQGGQLWQWESIDLSKFYLIGVDTASASGGDNSTIQVFDFMNFNQHAEFCGKLEVFDFCKVMHIVNKLYPNNQWVIENNSYGNQVVETLSRSSDNFNLYIYKDQRIKKKVFTPHKRLPYGIPTTSKTRPLMMDSLYTYIVDDPTRIRSERLALELIGLVEKVSSSSTRVEADKGSHDDLSLALSFICYVRMYDPPLGMSTSINTSEVDNILDTVAYNDEVLRFTPQQVGTRSRFTEFNNDKHSIDQMNTEIFNHVKNKLHDMDSKDKINILDIIGYNRS